MSIAIRSRYLRVGLLLLGLTLVWSKADAATVLTGFYPTGAKLGSKTEIRVSGSFDNWPVSFWCSNPEIKIVPLSKKGTVSLEASNKAQIGPCWIRAYDSKGFSTEKVFFLGNYSESTETEPNDLPASPQKILGPTALSGKLQKAGDVDCYSYSLKKGETLIASVTANQFLQAPMDAILQVVSPDGFVLAQDHDEKKLDPEIVFKAPNTGDFIIRVFAFPSTPDSSIHFAGGDTYNYRLTLTNGPFPIAPWPLAFGAHDKGEVGLKGWNLEGVEPVQVSPTIFSGESEIHWRYNWSQPVNLLRTPEKSVIFPLSSSNLTLTIPVSLSLESRPKMEANVFSFHAIKGKPLDVIAQSDSLGWHMNPVLRIKDSKGGLVQIFEPSTLHKDTEGIFTPKSDGIYTMEISDLFGHHSARHLCHITIRENIPDWDLKAVTDSIKLEHDKPTELTLNLIPKNGFKNLIEMEATGLPEGMKMVRKEPGKPGDKTIALVFSAKPNSKPGAFQLWAWTKGDPGTKRRVQITQENLPTRPDFWIQWIPADPTAPPVKSK